MSGWRLSERQAQLLEMALAPPAEAAAAWRRFLAAADVASLDGACQELLGLLYRKLAASEEDVPELGRLKGVYRRDWYANQLMLRRTREALAALERADVEAMVLGGAALAPLLHSEVGARPMDDTVVAVRPSAVPAALAALGAAGWRIPSGAPEALVTTRLGAALRDPGGGELALRWYPFPLPSADDDVWAAAIEVEVEGTTIRCPRDQLLYALARGSQWEPAPRSFLWAVDAVALMRSGGSADWERLVRQAVDKHLAPAVAATLSHLRETVSAPAPEAVIDELRAEPATRADRLALAASSRAPTPLRVARVHRARREAVARLEPERRVGFAGYVQQLAGLERRSQVPLHAAWRSLAIGARALRPR
jgi:hypothetical protein